MPALAGEEKNKNKPLTLEAMFSNEDTHHQTHSYQSVFREEVTVGHLIQIPTVSKGTDWVHNESIYANICIYVFQIYVSIERED